MNTYRDMAEWRKVRRGISGSVGFVPTMGALHEGHLSLLQRSLATNDRTVLSIYVNPTQFNNPDDLTHYPATLEADLAAAQALGVDYVILPTYDQMYADDFRYQVSEHQFSEQLCGRNRPGHFTGVLTVVMKLLNLVQPDQAYFGQKDYQQYLLIKDMCAAFFMPVEIIGCETVRECDGLAMSSRNQLLNKPARQLARHFNQALRSSAQDEQIKQDLTALGFQVDYIETRDQRRFGAVVLDCDGKSVRLIDNVSIGEVA